MTNPLVPGRGLVAVDLGSSSGRVVLGAVSGDRLETTEVHRFANGPVERDGRLYWDIDAILGEIGEGLRRAAAEADGVPLTIGFDSFGVDYVLLDAQDRRLSGPRHMRDPRTRGVYTAIDRILDPAALHRRTGAVAMEINTAAQLFAERTESPDLHAAARAVLFVPDYLAWTLTGRTVSELTIAATSQLIDPMTRNWAWDVIDALGFPRHLFNPLVEPGTVIGPLLNARDHGLPEGSRVIAVASHDTASAAAAAPVAGPGSAFVSLGTWALLGRELTAPDLGEESRLGGFTNECGVAGTIVHHKILPGLWLLQECRRAWIESGFDLSHAAIHTAAAAEPRGRWLFDVADPRFTAPGDMPAAIVGWFAERGLDAPQGVGPLARAIYDSLAVSHRQAIADVERVTGRAVDTLHVVSGGAQAGELCQAVADAARVRVTAGPVEAASLGNLVLQLAARGEIGGVGEGRALIGRSCPVTVLTPA